MVNFSQIDPTVKAKWVGALRSGEYRQARGMLKDGTRCYCCLGVLAEVSGAKWIENGEFAAVPHIDGTPIVETFGSGYLSDGFAGLHHRTQEKLAGFNDQGATFDFIADYIEREL